MVVGTASYFCKRKHVSVTGKGRSLGWPLGWGQVGFFCLVIPVFFTNGRVIDWGAGGTGEEDMQWTISSHAVGSS